MSRIIWVQDNEVKVMEFPSLEQALHYVSYIEICFDVVVFDCDGNITEVF